MGTYSLTYLHSLSHNLATRGTTPPTRRAYPVQVPRAFARPSHVDRPKPRHAWLQRDRKRAARCKVTPRNIDQPRLPSLHTSPSELAPDEHLFFTASASLRTVRREPSGVGTHEGGRGRGRASYGATEALGGSRLLTIRVKGRADEVPFRAVQQTRQDR